METYSFGEWLRARRDRFRLTRKEVADAALCSVAMLRKIEDDERRPSEELACSLAEALRIPAEQLEAFVEVARGERPLDALGSVGLGDGLPIIPAGEPDRRHNLPRQKTLQALIDWSWFLLTEKERVLLRRLSIFAGSWNLETAEVVVGITPLTRTDVFDGLEQLINKSMLTVQYLPGGPLSEGPLSEGLFQRGFFQKRATAC